MAEIMLREAEIGEAIRQYAERLGWQAGDVQLVVKNPWFGGQPTSVAIVKVHKKATIAEAR